MTAMPARPQAQTKLPGARRAARLRTRHLALLLALAACAPAQEPAQAPARDPASTSAVPAAPTGTAALLLVSAASALPARRSNAQMAADFLDLEFQTETGRRLPRLTRFEGPVTIGFSGPAPESARADLALLVQRIRTEAGIDLRLSDGAAPPAITIAFASRATLGRLMPSAVCFVIPGVASLAEYQARQGSAALDWSRLPFRSRAAVLLPFDTSPQEMRDCLHEEVAQALGPLNDLYRLPDSVFNDDNFLAVLTGFDMLMLRLHYAPELSSGMTRAEVAARLPALLARLNPAGEGAPAGAGGSRETPRAFLAAIDQSLTPGAPETQRVSGARQSLRIAQSQGWQDSRMALAQFALGRALSSSRPDEARAAYLAAWRIDQTLPDGGIHAAHVALQLAALDLGRDDLDAATGWIDSARPALRLAENPALEAMFLLVEAAIAEARGQTARARALRLDSQARAGYGFGAESLWARRAAEIARLVAQSQQGADD